jgi:putative transposase
LLQRKVLELVQAERKILPMLGGKKVYHQIKPALNDKCLKMGRDKLFKLLSDHHLLIKPKRRYTTTTHSKHWLRKYPNIFKDLNITQPEQAWVSDITYIKTDAGNCYLNLVTDVFSRKIMGYAIAENMNTEEMKKAYEMAIANRTYPHSSLLHHSDRGLQYCSSEYVKLSTDSKIAISMTENGDPYENALAERMNRTLKEEFGLGRRLPSRQQAFRLVEEAVQLYNQRRPHLSLKMKTPNSVHLQKIPAT